MTCSGESAAAHAPRTRSPPPAGWCSPRFDVRMMMQWRKSTVWPLASVNRPSSNTCRNRSQALRVRLLELVEQHHRERLLAHAIGQRLRLVASSGSPTILRIDSTLWNSLMSSRMSRSADRTGTPRASWRARSCPCRSVRRTETRRRACRIGQPGLQHRHAIDDGIDGFVLTDHPRAEEAAQVGQVHALPIVQHLLRHAGQLRHRRQHLVAPHA